ncbi:SAM-dependent methyltransferase [Pseudonocardia parietis]|uniref:SAM-dependent methyltransferase n=1 Tax=Pseudonocardia parietis TaxID=570936 RepID=A0ABS4VLM8_9PSEU|nr:class I SAM-dependent methyltransferase [Pseudonocardia parietis]MBP2364816.1 SAM-dependent methyltransferase [Pseudonocardia parietis]
MDLPRSFSIREGGSRILNPFDEHKLATLGRALRLPAGSRILDLACGKGEMLCTWARDLGYTGLGVDVSSSFIADADTRARELGVESRVGFRHDDAAGFVHDPEADVASCMGASWIGGGPTWRDSVTGTLALLQRSVRPGGLLLLGEPFWKLRPQSEEALAACHAQTLDDFAELPSLLDHFADLDYDLVEVVMADEHSWDRYAASQWLAIRRWLDANPDDELHGELRTELDASPRQHLLHQRSHLGWGVFVLMRR